MVTGNKAAEVVLFITGILSAVVCLGKWGISGRAFTACAFLFLLIAAAERDIRTKRIPDRIVLGAGMDGIVSVLFFPEISLVSRGSGMLCVSLLLLVITLAVPGSFGGGDIKLMAASGIFLGWRGNLGAFVMAVFLAGTYCSWMLLRRKIGRRNQIAFGPFLCAGIMAEMLLSF